MEDVRAELSLVSSKHGALAQILGIKDDGAQQQGAQKPGIPRSGSFCSGQTAPTGAAGGVGKSRLGDWGGHGVEQESDVGFAGAAGQQARDGGAGKGGHSKQGWPVFDDPESSIFFGGSDAIGEARGSGAGGSAAGKAAKGSSWTARMWLPFRRGRRSLDEAREAGSDA